MVAGGQKPGRTEDVPPGKMSGIDRLTLFFGWCFIRPSTVVSKRKSGEKQLDRDILNYTYLGIRVTHPSRVRSHDDIKANHKKSGHFSDVSHHVTILYTRSSYN